MLSTQSLRIYRNPDPALEEFSRSGASPSFKTHPSFQPHSAFYTVEADTNSELGMKLGVHFGGVARSMAEARRREDGWQAKVEQAARYVPISEKHFPQYVEELRGYATGAEVDFKDLWALSLSDDLETLPAEHCTTVVTNSGRTLAHSEDWEADARDSVCVLKTRLGAQWTLQLFYMNTLGGNAVSVNSHGVVHAVNNVAHSDKAFGVPKNLIARCLTDSANPYEDCAVISAMPRLSGFNHNLMLKDGSVLNFESSPTHTSFAQVPSSPFVHTNHYLRQGLLPFEANGHATGTRERYARAVALARDPMNIDELKSLLADQSDGAAVSICNERQIGRAIIDLEQRAAHFWLRREEQRGWVSYPLDFL